MAWLLAAARLFFQVEDFLSCLNYGYGRCGEAA
jgi:hypothetical protein